MVERINGIFKDEFDLDAVFPTVTDAQDAVASAIHRYNTIRTHWSLALQTPYAVFSQAA
jgi:transposase InsO family protein